jgi:alkanesulfonate monooxygenase SsuD/methylene tetrahydromethanopterin reductase-like flavin-dependent oxidoreductase (luciferase family)
LDVVATLALLASHTARLKLGPSVYLLNLRHPLIAAKAFASLDYLSGGRIVMAVGTGANLADYAACGVPLDDRGPRLDESIKVLRKLWLEQKVSFHGRFFSFDDVSIEPRPQPRRNNDFGTIDLWIGGRARPALRRTALLGDGYFASFQTPREYAAAMATIREIAVASGRAAESIESGLILRCRIATSREQAIEEMRPLLDTLGTRTNEFLERAAYGTAGDIIDHLEQYIAAGLNKFVLWPVATPHDWANQVERVGREIAAHYIDKTS